MRFSALEAVLFKRTPEGWTFDSPYPWVFCQRRWTYLLTDAQKERLTKGLRLFGLLDLWYAAVLGFKLRVERSRSSGPWGTSGSG